MEISQSVIFFDNFADIISQQFLIISDGLELDSTNQFLQMNFTEIHMELSRVKFEFISDDL